MLVERRRDSMPAQVVVRTVVVWMALSALLLFVNFGAIANQNFDGPIGSNWTMAQLVPIVGRETVELTALIAVPILSLGIALLLAARLAWRLNGERTVIMTCLAMALSAPLLFQMRPLQLEQNGWQIACALVAPNGLSARSPQLGGWIAGLALAVCIAITIELWPFALAICVFAALKWLRNRSDRMLLVHITQSLAVGSITIYLAKTGLGDLASYCDRVGPVQIAMLCWGALILSALSRVGPIPSGALIGGFLLAGGGALAMQLLAAPGCTIEIATIWQQELSFALESLALPLIGIWAAIHLAARNVEWLRHWWFDYALLLLAALVVIITTGRGGAIAAAMAAVPLGWQLQLWLDHTGRMKNPIKRVLALVLLTALLMPSLIPKLLPLMDSARVGHNIAQSSASLGIALPNG